MAGRAYDVSLVAVGGTPQSVARAGLLGLPLAIAIIGGEPRRFAPLFDLYREQGRRAGHDPAKQSSLYYYYSLLL